MATHSCMQPLILDCGVHSTHDDDDPKGPQQCLLCKEEGFDLSKEHTDVFLKHLLEAHKLVIGDVEQVANLKRYVEYWRSRLEGTPLQSVCVKMEDRSEDGTKHYFMLCSILPEDKQLRSKLQRDRLQQVLDTQQKEREDNSQPWKCLFCNESFVGNRSLVLNHMNTEHSFNIGHPDNLVNVESFLTKLHNSLERLLCLYCERTFKDKFTLKEHMRKKFHKKLNPNNKEYDEYYLVNYLELGKDSGSTKKVIRRGKGGVVAYVTSAESDGEEGWQEGDDLSLDLQSRSACLYCRHTASEPSLVFLHMSKVHDFDIASLTKEFQLNFYHQVKIINYIRRQVLERRCVQCQDEHKDVTALECHMVESKHISRFVEQKQTWDQPEYYFPTYENDNLLSGLDCEEDSSLAEDCVIPEDAPSVMSADDCHLAPIMQVLNH